MADTPLEDEGVEAPAAEETHPDDVEGPGDDDYEGELSAASPGNDDEVTAYDEDDEAESEEE